MNSTGEDILWQTSHENGVVLSSFGGRRHQVSFRDHRTPRPSGWGRQPGLLYFWSILYGGLAVAGVIWLVPLLPVLGRSAYGLVRSSAGPILAFIATAAFVGIPGIIIIGFGWSAVKSAKMATRGYKSRYRGDGEVVYSCKVRNPDPNAGDDLHLVAVDIGQGDEIDLWEIARQDWERLTVATPVQVDVAVAVGHVYRIAPVVHDDEA